MHCVVFASTLVEMQHDARIDSDPILAFSCITFLHLVIKKSPTFLVINLCILQINVMQGLTSVYELAFNLRKYHYMYLKIEKKKHEALEEPK